MTNLKHYLPTILAFFLLAIVGCSSAPAETIDDDLSALLNKEPVVKTVEEPVVEEPEEEIPEENESEEPIAPGMTGSLDLQSDLDRCPHLKRKFSCDKYAIKICPPSEFGFAGFLPAHVSCKTSDISRNDICTLRACDPIADEGGIVGGYGGVVAKAEYSMVKRSEDGVVWHDYTLVRCGEMEEAHPEKDDCIFAK